MHMIELDGAAGEGGGQMLRTSLTLSMITGQPFRMTNIRAGRAKPGLMRQHLVAVLAAAEVSAATVDGAEIGSQTLTFVPHGIRAGDYGFAIGTAGSCTLVLQTLVVALLHADGPSTVRISGGTHNPLAPPAQFMQRAYCQLLQRMGADVRIALLRTGFYPAGGGIVEANIAPCARLEPLTLLERGALIEGYAEAFSAGIPQHVGTRELERVGKRMHWEGSQLRNHTLPAGQGPGNALLITLEHAHLTEVFAAFGEKSVSAQDVADNAVEQARTYLQSQAAVGEHLADQLMLPLALAGGGAFTAASVSQHALTNADVIGRFLPLRFSFEAQAPGAGHLIRAERA